MPQFTVKMPKKTAEMKSRIPEVKFPVETWREEGEFNSFTRLFVEVLSANCEAYRDLRFDSKKLEWDEEKQHYWWQREDFVAGWDRETGCHGGVMMQGVFIIDPRKLFEEEMVRLASEWFLYKSRLHALTKMVVGSGGNR